VFTIHNLAYQGWFGSRVYQKFGLPDSVMRFDGMEMHGSASYLKAGLQYSDFITTVSPTYAWEIQGSEYGCGMENVLQARSNRIYGILNGIDMDEWNPETDPHLGGYNYSADDMGNKEVLKQKFLESLGLPFWKHIPLFGIVARFAAQKGIRLLESTFEEILAKGTQIVVLGSGEEQFANSLKYFESKYPRQVRAFIKYDNTLAHQIEAASDYFLMPSRYEPCGLNQMYSLRYGTIPVVFSTGGLADTVYDCDENPDSGNGYVFHEYNRGAFLNAVDRALGLYHYPEIRYVVQQRGMRTDFSWEKSAQVYQQLYTALMQGY
jgi:starch synthase